ncbi:MAG: prepilin-type N-terminal cleavage/methylation domain-containing protein [Myxococcota bacterium]|nr:prepilin-type N-terminal cleavage/methylation domain-containing protein [Myxococcota bacterium]
MTRRNTAQGGFTLIELTIALVAGLIVALGIVGLSKEATRTFHEEVRNSAAESTLRTALDRLRADLQRAGYMSTANILADLRIARAPGDASNVARVNPAMGGILDLAGIHLITGGSLANTPLSLQQQPTNLSPDALEIAGNMTSTEQFEIQTVQPLGACQRLILSANSTALYRINALGGATPQGSELNNVFQPYPGFQYIVRLYDDTGRSQYLPTCDETPMAGFIAGVPYVDVDITGGAILTPQVTRGQGGITDTPGGRAWVNPVQIVRWEITSAANEPAQYQNALATQPLAPGTQDATKYDLVRSYVDAKAGLPIPGTMEVIAEYAVDLKFAFSVDNAAGVTGQTPVMVTYGFDQGATNQTWAADLTTTPGSRPQRIRIVRARVATRAAQPDRSVNVAVNNYGTDAFIYRYCIAPGGCTAGALQWARARTLTTEVSLPNQAGSFF